MKRITRRNLFSTLFLAAAISVAPLTAQERSVRVDFESGAFVKNPSIPFDEEFLIQGTIDAHIQYVKVLIYNEGKEHPLHQYGWNRYANRNTETFDIVVPGVLKSNSKYDFEIVTYRRMTEQQKQQLSDNLAERIAFFLRSNFQFDGKSVNLGKPKTVHKKLSQLIDKALSYQESQNNIGYEAPSMLVLEELKSQSEFRFKRFLKRKENTLRDSLARQLIDRKVKNLTALIMSELRPFFNSELVQHHRSLRISSVSTDKEPFSLPVNVGMYAWNLNTQVDGASVRNTNFTGGAGFTIPFNNKSRLASRTKVFDSFGFSMGVLFQPLQDANGIEFITPGVNLPLYTGLGVRLFNVVRLNGGVVLLGEKGLQDFSGLSVTPTLGLTFELNLWMGIKK